MTKEEDQKQVATAKPNKVINGRVGKYNELKQRIQKQAIDRLHEKCAKRLHDLSISSEAESKPSRCKVRQNATSTLSIHDLPPKVKLHKSTHMSGPAWRPSPKKIDILPEGSEGPFGYREDGILYLPYDYFKVLNADQTAEQRAKRRAERAMKYMESAKPIVAPMVLVIRGKGAKDEKEQ